MPGGIVFLVGMRPRVVMGADDHALDPLGVPGTDQVHQVERLAGLGMNDLQWLLADHRPHLLEMLGHHLPLPGVGLRPGGARTDLADLLQVS